MIFSTRNKLDYHNIDKYRVGRHQGGIDVRVGKVMVSGILRDMGREVEVFTFWLEPGDSDNLFALKEAVRDYIRGVLVLESGDE